MLGLESTFYPENVLLVDRDISYSESRSLATLGISYINATGANNTLYQAYWGALAPSNVTAVLNAVATENSNNRT